MIMLRHPHTAKFLKTGLFDGLRSFEELERRISKITVPSADRNGDASKKARGDAFEVFVAAYLATQRSQLVESLWPSMKLVPPSIRRHLGWKPDDKGADGLIKTASGELRGYQAKFRTGRASLPWGEVATFFGYTDRCDDRLLVTNSTSVAEVAEERSDFLSLRGNDFDQLGPADLKAIVEWLKGETPRPRPKATPRPHQRVALAAIRKSFKREDRGTVVSACGTGKTFLALWAAEALGRKSVIVLLPSLALIRQTLRDWANDTNWKRFDYICVCSDATVSQGEDSLVVRPTELPFSVSTDAAKVRKFLRHPFDGVKVVFTTYQSAPIVAQAMSRGDVFDFGIFDEAHKTAGAEGKQNAFALTDRNLRIRQRLFLTATPKKYQFATKAADRGKDLEPVYSMDQPAIYGPVIHKLSFGEAAAKGIICNYKVIISVVTSSIAEQSRRNRGLVMVKGSAVKAPQVVNQLALAQAASKHRIRKAFTFHRNLRSADSFVSDGKEGVGTHLPDFKAFHVSGEMSTADRESVLKEFEGARCGLVSNVRCLTEGVDVPTVDMVAFMSPKRSRVDIVQAVGRAMRTSPETGKKVGYVLVPLHVELKRNESIEDAVARAGFDDVWQVLAAMQEQDDALDEAIQRIQADRKLGRGFDDSLFQRRVEIIGPPIALAALRRAVTIRCLDRLSRPWDEYVQMLLAFKKKHRHLRVPADAKRPWEELAKWVEYVRYGKRRGYLSAERVECLEKLRFVWRFDGETLDATDGLLNEKQFGKSAGLTTISRYRSNGLVTPVGYALTTGGLSAFYNTTQIKELRKKLGITLESTKGLLSERQFAGLSGFTQISGYRKDGLIRPVGYAMSASKISAFYHPRQIKELKNKLGITLESTRGLLNEHQFRRKSGLSAIAVYREKGLIRPVGYAMAGPSVGPFYHPNQIGELKKNLGITLGSTKGLLNESQFGNVAGITAIARYRQEGLLKPVGYALTSAGLSPFYRRQQVRKLRKKLGITLESTVGLLNEKQFRAKSGLASITRYYNEGLITPVGLALTNGGVSRFYHPRQIKELKKKLGISLESVVGLLNEQQVRTKSGLSGIGRYRKNGLITPVGHAMTNAGVSPFYHPRQISELRKKLGITLESTTGLLNENQFKKQSKLTGTTQYREKGLIKPVGYAMAGPKISAFYRPRQIKELKKKLGITLESTRGLLSEKQFRRKCGLDSVARYIQDGLLKPVGHALSAAGLSRFYHPRQVKELRRKIGITLDSIKGLVTENQISTDAKYRVSGIARYRKQGLITPVRYAKSRGGKDGMTAFYHPRQIKELKKKLGITLESVAGLLNENQFRKKSKLTGIARYREKGLVTPAGFALTHGGVSAFYHPRQVKELRKKLGITLESTAGLLNESQFSEKAKLSRMAQYREKGLIMPVGYAMAGPAISPFYHPRQINELRKKLGITLESTAGLLNEKQFKKKCGLYSVARHLQDGLLKPVGYALSAAGLDRFYHPRQIKELRRKVGITLDSTKGLLTEKQISSAGQYRVSGIARYRKQGLITPAGYAKSRGGKDGMSAFYHPRQIKELRRVLAAKRA